MDLETAELLLSHLTPPQELTLGSEHKVLVVPSGSEVRNLKEFMPPPERVKQKVELLTAEAFINYVERFSNADSTVFADEPVAKYEAVIDYHLGSEDGETPIRKDCEHIAFYQCPQSEEWKTWTGKDGAWFEQTEFAMFLESNLTDISQPDGAELLQMALELKVHKAAEFQSEIRFTDGQTRFRYEETVRGTTVAGDIEIPQSFLLLIPVFVDGERHTLDARFRYRMDNGKLKLGYELIRPKLVWNLAVKTVTDTISKGLLDTQLYVGKRW